MSYRAVNFFHSFNLFPFSCRLHFPSLYIDHSSLCSLLILLFIKLSSLQQLNHLSLLFPSIKLFPNPFKIVSLAPVITSNLISFILLCNFSSLISLCVLCILWS
jgi:hypothetical protein